MKLFSLISFLFFPIFISADLDTLFTVSGGYRIDELCWSLPGGPKGPDILSELKWKDIESAQIAGFARILLGDKTFLQARGDYGWIQNGKNRDSDYLGDHRTYEFSRSHSEAGRGHVYDYSAALGYECRGPRSRLSLIPLAGYSRHEQQLHMYNGCQEIARTMDTFQIIPSSLGHFKGLNSTYTAKWRGPWIGLNFQWEFSKCLTFFGEAEYHWTTFSGHGNWNLRTDIPSGFDHHAEGNGEVFLLGIRYQLKGAFFIEIYGNYQDWETKKGIEKLFYIDFYDPENKGWRTYDFNGVKWRSGSIMAGLGIIF